MHNHVLMCTPLVAYIKPRECSLKTYCLSPHSVHTSQYHYEPLTGISTHTYTICPPPFYWSPMLKKDYFSKLLWTRSKPLSCSLSLPPTDNYMELRWHFSCPTTCWEEKNDKDDDVIHTHFILSETYCHRYGRFWPKTQSLSNQAVFYKIYFKICNSVSKLN